jgi:cytochrome c-type biogenesis protein CcmH
MACASPSGNGPSPCRYRLAGMKKLLAALLALGALLAVPALAGAAAPRASLPDIEDEVMCPTCGVALNQAFSPQAERERDFIRAQIARGRTKQQIKDELVSEFGPAVLATPQTSDSEFNLTAYLVPVLAIAAALIALVVGLRRWRTAPATPVAPESLPELNPEDSARLEQDLSRFDA